ncbi:hypothetical protein LIER_11341 [Lithospermum erythrorhizon]|uniref:Reverse transcriptase domain-containing protein n=1 Tax=Lithospermum erythrorhizon TaxID=34254 RepID=A0AAV3PQ12_LITER
MHVVDPEIINKVFPKDCYPLPNIDRLVDSSTGYKVVDFHTAFVTEYDIYCWKVMAFGLKNAGATYQRMVNKVFSTQIDRNMQIYVDEMFIKNQEAADHEANRRESFDNFQRGIEPNPDKIAAVQAIQSARTHKEALCLTGRIAALTWFISRTGYRSFPFFKAIKNWREFEWTPKFSESTLSSVLIRDEENVQKPMYYVNWVMRYPSTEKMVYALIVSARKLKPYFKVHPDQLL